MDFVILCKEIFAQKCEYEAHGKTREDAIENLRKHAQEVHGMSEALKDEVILQAMKDKAVSQEQS